jgi:uncharacterized membrane protein
MDKEKQIKKRIYIISGIIAIVGLGILIAIIWSGYFFNTGIQN